MADIDYDTIQTCLPNLTEDEALQVFHDLRRRFGWAGTLYMRGDAEGEWATLMPDTDMPDAVWDAIQSTWAWKHALSEANDNDWDLVRDAVEDAIKIAAETTLDA